MSDIKQLAEALVNLKVTEVACLAKILKEEYGIEPAATSLAAPVPEITELAKEKTSFNVVLKSAGSSKLAVVKLVKELTGLGLKESKDLVDSAPKNIKEGISKDQAEAVKKQLEEIGAEAELN